MNDFIDRVFAQPPTLHVERRPCEIHCDTYGCDERITVTHDIDETQAAAMVRAAGWSARMGWQRWYHHCARHAERSHR